MDAHAPSIQIYKQDDYRRIDKEIKKNARADKRNYIEQKVMQAEDEVKRGDSRTLYKLTNENGRQETDSRWTFEKLLMAFSSLSDRLLMKHRLIILKSF